MTYEELKQIQEERNYSMERLSEYSGIPLHILRVIMGEDPGSADEPSAGTSNDYAVDTSKAQTIGEPAIAYGNRSHKNPGEYTLEDYYAWPKEERIELIDGVIFVMEAPTFVHQHIASVIHGQLGMQIRSKNGQCLPMTGPVDVRLDCDNKTMVQPDILILCDKDKIRRWGIDGAPEFVLEIISGSTSRKDYTKKLQKYTDAGVKEYWIVDPIRKVLVTYDLREDATPCLQALTGKKGLALYDGEIEIDLDEIAETIREYPAAK